jgi:hypothetical protein
MHLIFIYFKIYFVQINFEVYAFNIHILQNLFARSNGKYRPRKGL